MTVGYGTSNGTAGGYDYTAVSGNLTFAAGETVKTVRVPIINDTTAEPKEDFFFNLTNPTWIWIAHLACLVIFFLLTIGFGTRVVSVLAWLAAQSYIQRSRGEFSCVKRSCIEFQNAWVSDRTACYLASGKPVVVQDTGPSEFLPNGEGMFRFATPVEAARAFDQINADYEHHCRVARQIV